MPFSEDLISWYLENQRELPWRSTKDPYKVWLSEVILQQTRVDQGMSYYLKFTENYPKIEDLAKAPEEEVLKLWQGLGYYSRARNLLTTARHVVEELNGEFPSSYDEIIKLKGIGPYTAAAIASFCFKERVPVIDGNVYRVLSRIFGIKTPIDTTEGQQEFRQLAAELQSTRHPDLHNQAIMEFGAIQCTPNNPECQCCVFKLQCVALDQKLISTLPTKKGRTKVKSIQLHYLVFSTGEQILLRQRRQKGFWHKLWDFPGIETELPVPSNQLLGYSETIAPEIPFNPSQVFGPFNHVLSHRKIEAYFHWIPLEKPFKNGSDDLRWVPKMELEKYAIPRLIDVFLQSNANEIINGRVP